MNFGDAIAALKQGQRVARSGWNGKGMWLQFIAGHDYLLNPAPTPLLGTVRLPWIGMKTADNCFVPWLASQTDILADDWSIL